MSRPIWKLLFAGLMALGGAAEARHPHHRAAANAPAGQAGQFDYYALALSWSPSYCANHHDTHQCASGRKLGFVLHGLWPQYLKGYPENCSTVKLNDALRQQYAALYPSPKLIEHEWIKHGTCSGLEPAAYFVLSDRLKTMLTVPPAYRGPEAPIRVGNDAFKQAFRDANRSLPDNAVLPFCSGGGRFLQEIHACYDVRGGPLSCGANEIKRSASSCGQASFLIPSVR
ncbi:MAG: ribonuclease [Pseudomonadota bacterium]